MVDILETENKIQYNPNDVTKIKNFLAKFSRKKILCFSFTRATSFLILVCRI